MPGQELLELPEDHFPARASELSGKLSSSTGRMRAQASGKTTEARVSRPPARARAALTASAIASRVRTGEPAGPTPLAG